MSTGHRLRVVVGKPGLDGHDRGAKVVARALRDAGMEVLYTGVRVTPATIVSTAVQEDADAVLLSIMSGAHLHLAGRVCAGLTAAVGDSGDTVPVIVGGIIPTEDIPALLDLGVAAVFQPGASLQSIVQGVHDAVQGGPRA